MCVRCVGAEWDDVGCISSDGDGELSQDCSWPSAVRTAGGGGCQSWRSCRRRRRSRRSPCAGGGGCQEEPWCCRSCRIISGGCGGSFCPGGGCGQQALTGGGALCGRAANQPGPTLPTGDVSLRSEHAAAPAAAATGRTCLTSRCSSRPVISLLLLPSSAVTSGLQEKKVLPTKTVRSQEVQEEASPARCSSPCRRDGRGLCLTQCPPTTRSQVRRKQKKKRSRVTLVSPPRSEHGDDVSVLLQVLGLALPNPLGLVAERS